MVSWSKCWRISKYSSNVRKLEKSNQIKKILITSNTLSSSKIISKIKLKKVVHQFFQ